MSARTYPCCDCCPSDPVFHAENPPDSHDVPCDICSPTCGHNVERIRREAKAEALREFADVIGPLADFIGKGADANGAGLLKAMAGDMRNRAARIEADDA